MRRTLLCWHHCFKFSGNDRLRNRDGGFGTCCWTLVKVKLCWFRYWYTVIMYVSLIFPNVVSFFHKNEGKRRFVIAFKIVIGLCYFSPLPGTQLKWVLSLCFFDDFRPQIVHFSTIDSFRLFLHRVSSNHYLYHFQSMDPMYPSSRGREPVGEVKIKLCASLASQRIHCTSQWQVLKDPRDHFFVIFTSQFCQRTNIFFGLTTDVKYNRKWRFSVESLEAIEDLVSGAQLFSNEAFIVFRTSMFT